MLHSIHKKREDVMSNDNNDLLEPVSKSVDLTNAIAKCLVRMNRRILIGNIMGNIMLVILSVLALFRGCTVKIIDCNDNSRACELSVK